MPYILRSRIFGLAWAIAGLVIASLLEHAVSAQEQRPCGPREAILGALAERFGETVVARGLEGEDGVAMVELSMNPGTGTWTLMRQMPGGPLCLITAGQAWEPVDDAPKPLGDPS